MPRNPTEQNHWTARDRGQARRSLEQSAGPALPAFDLLRADGKPFFVVKLDSREIANLLWAVQERLSANAPDPGVHAVDSLVNIAAGCAIGVRNPEIATVLAHAVQARMTATGHPDVIAEIAETCDKEIAGLMNEATEAAMAEHK